MINLIPMARIITGVAVVYAACVAGVVWFRADPLNSIWDSMKVAVGGGTALNSLLLLILYFGWRKIWSRFPILNTALFPDLNGEWTMRIHWTGLNNSQGSVDARASIKQNMIKISMEVAAPDSDSETLLASPARDGESGRPMLYYIYRVVPKQIDPSAGLAYEGAAVLRFTRGTKDSLSGNYFTNKQTKGHFELIRNA
jgi:hypothetical protein